MIDSVVLIPPQIDAPLLTASQIAGLVFAQTGIDSLALATPALANTTIIF